MIEKICQIATEFKKNNKSIHTLLEETGYYDTPQDITVELIEKYLKKNIIESWIAYSEDKRTSSGWYIIKKGKSTIIGYASDNKTEQVKEFSNRTNACALFILNEIQSIKNS